MKLDTIFQSFDFHQSILSTIRYTVLPYLPPPLVRSMRILETSRFCGSICGYSISILLSIFIIFITWKTIWRVTSMWEKRRFSGDPFSDHEDGFRNNDKGELNNRVDLLVDNKLYSDTTVLFGPLDSGKTALYYSLLISLRCDHDANLVEGIFNDRIPDTVMSVTPVATVINKGNEKSIGSTRMGVRIVDYPGHPSLLSRLHLYLLPEQFPRLTRGVFVVDSTMPMTDSAKILFNYILHNEDLIRIWRRRSRDDNNGVEKLKIMIVCGKEDKPNAKHWRKIKIQLRNEIEKLRLIHLTIPSNIKIPTGSGDVVSVRNTAMLKIDNGKNVDLDNLGPDTPIQLYFLSLSCMDPKTKGMRALRSFVMEGEIVLDSSSSIINSSL